MSIDSVFILVAGLFLMGAGCWAMFDAEDIARDNIRLMRPFGFGDEWITPSIVRWQGRIAFALGIAFLLIGAANHFFT